VSDDERKKFLIGMVTDRNMQSHCITPLYVASAFSSSASSMHIHKISIPRVDTTKLPYFWLWTMDIWISCCSYWNMVLTWTCGVAK
jgi:hypothetical protein